MPWDATGRGSTGPQATPGRTNNDRVPLPERRPQAPHPRGGPRLIGTGHRGQEHCAPANPVVIAAQPDRVGRRGMRSLPRFNECRTGSVTRRGAPGLGRDASGRRERPGIVRGHDVLAQRSDGGRGQLEVGDAQRDPDDGEAQQHTGHHVGDGHPQSGQQEPKHIADEGPGSGVATGYQGPAEGPKSEPRPPDGPLRAPFTIDGIGTPPPIEEVLMVTRESPPRQTWIPTGNDVTHGGGGPPGGGVAAALAPMITALVDRHAGVGFRFWDGSTLGLDSAVGTIDVRSPDALKRIVWAPGELGLARAFVAGELAIDGDLFEVLVALRDAMPRELRRIDPRTLAATVRAAGRWPPGCGDRSA